MTYELVVGLEVHAQLATRTKLFCGCLTRFGSPPNTQTCPVCLGMPGVLPVVNRVAFEYALLTALALNCRIPPETRFDRKNYYYPDLPKNYQISQNDLNLGVDGYIDLGEKGGRKRIRIANVHLEEDAGKLVHPEGGPRDYSVVDLNRTGIPLVEIVTEPDMGSTAEVEDFMETLRAILLYLGVSDCKMEEGSLRFEASVSVRPEGQRALGRRVEMKNLNSMKAVCRAVAYEHERQSRVLDTGGVVEQETRLWSESRGISERMRTKEEAKDYRFFPEPDIPPLEVSPTWLAALRARIPELPLARRRRFEEDYGLPPYDAGVLTAQRALADYFEVVAVQSGTPKAASNWMMNAILQTLKERKTAIEDLPLPPERLVELIRLVEEGEITGTVARREIFPRMLETGHPPARIAQQQGLAGEGGEVELRPIVTRAVETSPEAVEAYRKGKKKALGSIMGRIMRATRGKADPKRAMKLIEEEIKRRFPS
jgi:aspartyl-tRNA(Asn)/glutamyl-tRNA(Gln) amidotransferase subunit B